MPDALVIKNLTKKYGQQLAVDDISFNLKAGEFFAYDVARDYKAARRLIGLAPQDYNFEIFRTPYEILLYNAGYFGIRPRQAKGRAPEFF